MIADFALRLTPWDPPSSTPGSSIRAQRDLMICQKMFSTSTESCSRSLGWLGVCNDHASACIPVIVCFFDMRREARRTLFSLTDGYQRGIEVGSYEVIAIDNGSNEPLDETEVLGTALISVICTSSLKNLRPPLL